MAERKKSMAKAGIRDDRRSLPIALLRAREAVMQYFRPLHQRGKTTEQQWRVIRVLHFDGEIDAGDLARRSYLLAPSLSRILKDLEAEGYVKRRAGEVDSRQSLLSLTPKATAMVAGVAWVAGMALSAGAAHAARSAMFQPKGAQRRPRRRRNINDFK